VARRFAQALRLAASVAVLGACVSLGARADDSTSSAVPMAADPPALTSVAANEAVSGTDSAASAAVPTPPPFEYGATVEGSVAYTNNASGLSGGSKSDVILTAGASGFLHEHSGRVSLDATNSFYADFYAEGTRSAQFNDSFSAVGSVIAIPEYLTIGARAFAAPVLTSDIGIATAGNRVISGAFHNSFGYLVQPDLRFRFGDFMTSETTANYGSTYFLGTGGSSITPVIPGLPGPQDVTSRSATQIFSSGQDFVRLNWALAGAFSEVDRSQGLLSEKTGVGNLRYAINHEFQLLGTVGYDAVTNTIPLSRNVSGLVALGGFEWTWGPDFTLQIQAGRKYNDASYVGSLHYNITPTSSLVGSLDDTITTPEGQLLNNLINLTATTTGDLTTQADVYGNGSVSSLSVFSPQSLGGNSFDQQISRNQTVSLAFMEDWQRDHAALTLFGTRRTILSTPVVGLPRTESWGVRAAYSRDISPLMQAGVSSSYRVTQELGGTARIFDLNANLGYTMTREMRAYLRGDYLDRQSSASLNALSPLTGSLSDYRITLGISRTL